MSWNVSKKIALYLSLIVLAGCVAATGPGTDRVDIDQFNQQLLALPGAVVDLNAMTVVYPGDVLFASGSALPFPGGLEVLEPLIALILQSEEITGEATVRSSGHADGYDLVLAEKRLELLGRLFQNRGVSTERIKFEVDAGAGPPLELHFQLRSVATSPGENS